MFSLYDCRASAERTIDSNNTLPYKNRNFKPEPEISYGEKCILKSLHNQN